MASQSIRFSKVLKRKEVLTLAFGAMVGWGWVVLAGEWANTAGSIGAILAFVIGGLMVCLVGLTYAELTSAMPLAGGEHNFSYRGLGLKASFICTWAIILGYVSVCAFEAVALPTVIEYIFPAYKYGYLWTIAGWDVYATWVAVGVIGSVVIAALNYYGIKPSTRVQLVLTVVLAVVGLLFILGSLVNGEPSNMQPLIADGLKGILLVVIMTPFMFVGFDVIPQAAEEIDLPYRTLGLLIVLSVILATLWYILIILGVSLALAPDERSFASVATADAMAAVYGNKLAADALILGGVAGILTSWNGFYIGASRVIYAMGRARMLPEWLGRLHPKHRTPSNAIILIGILSALAPFFGRKMLVWLVDAGGFSIVIAYFMVALSFLVLRFREPDMKRPYKVKYGKAVGVIACLLSFGFILLYLPGAPSALVWPYEWVIIVGWAILGVIFYLWSARAYGGEAEKIMYEEVYLREN